MDDDYIHAAKRSGRKSFFSLKLSLHSSVPALTTLNAYDPRCHCRLISILQHHHALKMVIRGLIIFGSWNYVYYLDFPKSCNRRFP
jgi:hypothetical protein